MSDTENSFFYHHLRPNSVPNKELYLRCTLDIEDSFTGLVQAMGLHSFFIESALEIRNSIKLFEDGFVGAAFYSARTAVEIARIVTLFSAHDEPTETELYTAWTSGGKFPFDGQIKQDIKEASDAYSQIFEVLPDFFNEQSSRLRRMQKYIHKQGYVAFHYRMIRTPERESKMRETIVGDFDEFVKYSLTEIALLRLCVDQFPLLLNDPSVRRRIHFESVTEPYSEDFMKLIGSDIIKAYRQTDFYQSIVEHFMQNDEVSDESLTVINDNYYSRSFWPLIKPELFKLPIHDQLAILLFNSSKKISNVYTIGGLHHYFSDVKTIRSALSWDSRTFEAVRSTNVPYDEALLSYFQIKGDEYWVEHNTALSENEIKKIGSATSLTNHESIQV